MYDTYAYDDDTFFFGCWLNSLNLMVYHHLMVPQCGSIHFNAYSVTDRGCKANTNSVMLLHIEVTSTNINTYIQ